MPRMKRSQEANRKALIHEPPPPPSMDELIAECRAVGWEDLAKAMERVKYLESPVGQRAIEREERRLSGL